MAAFNRHMSSSGLLKAVDVIPVINSIFNFLHIFFYGIGVNEQKYRLMVSDFLRPWTPATLKAS